MRHLRLADDVAQQVQQLIEDLQIEPGGRLPPERELADQLGVARASIREGLRTLEMMGVIEILPGRGSFVTGNVSSPLDSLISSWFSVHRDWLRDVIELREAVEAQVARLAAVRATPDDIAAINRTVASMRLAAEANDPEAFVEADAAFHDAVAHASRNPLLRRALASVAREIYSYRVAVGRLYGRARLERDLTEHEAIARALEARDALAAWHAMRQHIVSVPRDLDVLTDHVQAGTLTLTTEPEAGASY
jgi:GntR family transcriptional repressor for pyruvate dehydrogenase complex